MSSIDSHRKGGRAEPGPPGRPSDWLEQETAIVGSAATSRAPGIVGILYFAHAPGISLPPNPFFSTCQSPPRPIPDSACSSVADDHDLGHEIPHVITSRVSRTSDAARRLPMRPGGSAKEQCRCRIRVPSFVPVNKHPKTRR